MKAALIPDYLKMRLTELPDKPGIYLFKDDSGKPIYIGKAVSIRKRVLSHFRNFGESFSKAGLMLQEVRRIDYIETPNEAEALLLEAGFVKENMPKYNAMLKDDKSYPYLKITNEKFPRLVITRGRKPDGGRYFGPYTSGFLLKKGLKILRKLFPMRTCHPMPKKVCLMYHIGQCKGPCVGEIGEKEYGEMVKELTYFLEGRRDALVRSLAKRMKEHSERREYEQAKVLYEQMLALSDVSHSPQPKIGEDILQNLQKALSLPAKPERIECFDISNIHGSEAVGSMSVFVHAKPARKEYRHFRIKTVQGIDDYQMMKEVIRRRYSGSLSGKTPMPDLILIDGGKGHLSAAKSELDALGLEKQAIISIAKQHEHLFSPDRPAPYVFSQSSPFLQLLMHLRNEAHRFAITYHRRLHRKEAVLSRLDTIEGVGPKTRDKLLKKVGSVRKIASLSEDELSAKGRISKGLAARILQSLKAP